MREIMEADGNTTTQDLFNRYGRRTMISINASLFLAYGAHRSKFSVGSSLCVLSLMGQISKIESESCLCDSMRTETLGIHRFEPHLALQPGAMGHHSSDLILKIWWEQ